MTKVNEIALFFFFAIFSNSNPRLSHFNMKQAKESEKNVFIDNLKKEICRNLSFTRS